MPDDSLLGPAPWPEDEEPNNVRRGPWMDRPKGLPSQERIGNLRGIPLHDWQDKDPPRREWMVEGLFAPGTVVTLSGDGSAGKSLVLQQLLTCAVLGQPWFGRWVQQGKAILFGCEDDQDEMLRRQAAINRYYQTTMTDVADAGLMLVPRVAQDNVLMFLDKATWRLRPTELMDRLTERCEELGAQYIVIDPVALTFSGNQNDDRHVADYIVAMRRLALARQGVVILSRHVSARGRSDGTGESGSVAWSNFVRTRLFLHSNPAGGSVIETVKANYGPRGEKIPVRWHRGVFEMDAPPPVPYSE